MDRKSTLGFFFFLLLGLSLEEVATPTSLVAGATTKSNSSSGSWVLVRVMPRPLREFSTCRHRGWVRLLTTKLGHSDSESERQ